MLKQLFWAPVHTGEDTEAQGLLLQLLEITCMLAVAWAGIRDPVHGLWAMIGSWESSHLGFSSLC